MTVLDIDSGEIILNNSLDPKADLEAQILRRHMAYRQMKGWEERLRGIDHLIKEQLGDKGLTNMVAGGVRLSIRTRIQTTLDAGAMADILESMEYDRRVLLAIVRAAKVFEDPTRSRPRAGSPLTSRSRRTISRRGSKPAICSNPWRKRRRSSMVGIPIPDNTPYQFWLEVRKEDGSLADRLLLDPSTRPENDGWSIEIPAAALERPMMKYSIQLVREE